MAMYLTSPHTPPLRTPPDPTLRTTFPGKQPWSRWRSKISQPGRTAGRHCSDGFASKSQHPPSRARTGAASAATGTWSTLRMVLKTQRSQCDMAAPPNALARRRSRAASSTTSSAAARQPLGEFAQHRHLQRSRNSVQTGMRPAAIERDGGNTAGSWRGLAAVQATRRWQIVGRSVQCQRRQAARHDGKRTPIKKLPPRWAPGREL